MARSRSTKVISVGVRKGKRGRGARGKVPVFGLLKQGGNVHALIISNATKDTFFRIIRQKIRPDSVVYTDSFPAYDLLDVLEFHHTRINHPERFVDRPSQNAIRAATTEWRKNQTINPTRSPSFLRSSNSVTVVAAVTNRKPPSLSKLTFTVASRPQTRHLHLHCHRRWR